MAGSTGRKEYSEGVGSNALFFCPMGISFGTSGVIVADTFNHCIRRIYPDGTASLLAGQPDCPDYLDGTGTLAAFDHPHGIDQDRLGSIYVADMFNHVVRKITPAGKVTTFAGGYSPRPGKGGYRDGLSLKASFNTPSDVAVVDDIVYVADMQNTCIRRIRRGVVTHVAGNMDFAHNDGKGAVASFLCPRGIAATRECIYVSDPPVFKMPGGDIMPHIIRKITPDGEVTRYAGGQPGNADGHRLLAEFDTPMGLAIGPSGHLYVADASNNKIRRISPRGNVVTLIGSGHTSHLDGVGLDAHLSGPHSIALNPRMRQMFIADSFNHVIRRSIFVPDESPKID